MKMEKLTKRKQLVLDVLDEQISELEEKLAKAQPLIDELASLRSTRARLLDERSTTSGGGRRNTQLTMETMIQWFRENGAGTPMEIATSLGLNDNLVRSHLNRYADSRYRKNGEGTWTLIGEDAPVSVVPEDDEVEDEEE